LQYHSVAMQRFNVDLWNAIACIALHVGLALVLQILRPYGTEDVVRCSWNYCHAELAEASLRTFYPFISFDWVS